MTERDDYMRRQDAEHDMIRMRQPRPAMTATPAREPDNRVCKICDGGPGNECACYCGMEVWDTPTPPTAVSDSLTVPRPPKGTSLFAVNCKTGQWFYENHAHTWQTMPNPLDQTEASEQSEVIQSDREMAADLMDQQLGEGHLGAINMRLGRCDDSPTVQAFARHRTTAIRTLETEAERWENERNKWFDRTAIHNLARRTAEAKLREAREALEPFVKMITPWEEDLPDAYNRSKPVKMRDLRRARNALSPKEPSDNP